MRLDGKKKLCSKCSYTQFPENTIGLQIEFPKDLIYYKDEKVINCKDLNTYNDVYKKIVARINKIGKNLSLIINEKEHRTNIKISSQAKEKLKNFYFIKNENCIIK